MRCPVCKIALAPPAGANIFKCVCGHLVTAAAASTGAVPPLQSRSQPNQDTTVEYFSSHTGDLSTAALQRIIALAQAELSSREEGV